MECLLTSKFQTRYLWKQSHLLICGCARFTALHAKNCNFHQSLDEKCHWFINAVELGAEVSFAGITEIRNQGFTEIRSDGNPDPDSFGIVETIDMYPGGPTLNIEKGQWHSLKCLESGTVLLEAKDGGYRPLEADEVWNG